MKGVNHTLCSVTIFTLLILKKNEEEKKINATISTTVYLMHVLDRLVNNIVENKKPLRANETDNERL